MYKRIWTKAECDRSDTESKITFYDFGRYYAELIDNEWKCWEILSRTQTESGDIVEELHLAAQDWIPFDSYYSQTYLGKASDNQIFIRGWSIQTEEMKDLFPDLSPPAPLHPVVRPPLPTPRQAQ